MCDLLSQIALCIEKGKINKNSPFPPSMKGQDGTDELVLQALQQGIPPADVLNKGLVIGMQNIGVKFRENKVFVPEVLMAARAMSVGMVHLKPFFQTGSVKRHGTFIIGTVAGDLHDIGKNLVAMMVEGAGWEVVDLGVDVPAEKFIGALQNHPRAAVGLSALLTTTMINMEKIVKAIKEKSPTTAVLVGGAPLSQEFAEKIGADCYSPDPQGAIDYLNAHCKS